MCAKNATAIANKPRSRKFVLGRLKGLRGGDRKSVMCALVGHSRIVESCLGQITCSRCGAVIGDALVGTFDGSDDRVFHGHKVNSEPCRTCKKNYAKLGWHDKYLAKGV